MMIPKILIIAGLCSISLVLITAASVLPASTECIGEAMCLKGKITEIIDGDTVDVGDVRVRLALTSTLELDVPEGVNAKRFVEETCPVNSDVIIDEDDGQVGILDLPDPVLDGRDIDTGDKAEITNRILGKVYCQGIVLNEEILEQGHGELSTMYCAASEFSGEAWAKKFGC